MKLKLLLAIALAITVDLCSAQNEVTVRTQFEVSVIKPSSVRSTSTIFNHGVFTSTHSSLLSLVEMAYQVNEYQVGGAPGWLNSEFFDINAKAPPDKSNLGFAEAMPMLQTLLRERFKLAIHREKKMVEGYELAIGKNGPQLQKNTDGQLGLSLGRGRLTGHHISVAEIADKLSKIMNKPVSDATGIQGFFDVDLRWRPEDLSPTATDDLPTIFTALQEIGLKFQSRKVLAEVIVIDHIEKTPSEN